MSLNAHPWQLRQTDHQPGSPLKNVTPIPTLQEQVWKGWQHPVSQHLPSELHPLWSCAPSGLPGWPGLGGGTSEEGTSLSPRKSEQAGNVIRRVSKLSTVPWKSFNPKSSSTLGHRGPRRLHSHMLDSRELWPGMVGTCSLPGMAGRVSLLLSHGR